jgi:Na+/H+-translocating membrane pyrophosphatase
MLELPKPHVRVCLKPKSFFGGGTMGLGVAGLAVLGLTTFFIFSSTFL